MGARRPASEPGRAPPPAQMGRGGRPRWRESGERRSERGSRAAGGGGGEEAAEHLWARGRRACGQRSVAAACVRSRPASAQPAERTLETSPRRDGVPRRRRRQRHMGRQRWSSSPHPSLSIPIPSHPSSRPLIPSRLPLTMMPMPSPLPELTWRATYPSPTAAPAPLCRPPEEEHSWQVEVGGGGGSNGGGGRGRRLPTASLSSSPSCLGLLCTPPPPPLSALLRAPSEHPTPLHLPC